MTPEQFSEKMVELLPQLIRGVSRYESNYFSKGKISLPQLWALELLSRQSDCPMHELAQSLRISRPAATGLIDRLIAQGLVKREDDPGDRRVVRICITPKGKQIVTHIWDQKRRMFAKIFGQISESERIAYLAIVEKIVRNLPNLSERRG